MNADRVWTILDRQSEVRWGRDYLAGIRATTKEAPPGSKPAETYSALLQRRLQTLSITETAAAAVALFHPALFELKEQHMLSLKDAHHPLHGHPRARGVRLPTTPGTVQIAEAMGRIRDYPQVKDAKAGRYIPVPLLGDLLLFLCDAQGPYCIEWDVKRSAGHHGLPFDPSDCSEREVRKAQLREQIYTQYLGDLRIRIVRIHLQTFDKVFLDNLQRLVLLHWRPVNLHPELEAEVLEAYREAIRNGEPATNVIGRYAKRGRPPGQLQAVLHQGLWYRQLRADLFTPIVEDWPLIPETRDPLEVYRAEFARQE
jgi:hypothetical protein